MPPVDRDTPLLKEAIALWRAHRRELALETYARAVRDDPANGRVLVNAARAFGQHHQVTRARRLLDRLVALDPTNARLHHLKGETFRLLSLSSDAIESFEHARDLGSTDPMTHLELASLLERAGRLDDAQAEATRGLRLNPEQTWGLLIQGRIASRGGDAEQARSLFEAIKKRASEGSEIWCEAQGELALLFDTEGLHAQAWTAIDGMKSAQIARAAPERAAAEHVRSRFGSLFDDLTKEDLDAWAQSSVKTRPTGLLCGFPRSGTTLLEQMLDAHPGIESIEERDVLAGMVFPLVGAGHPHDAPVAPILRSLPKQRVKRLATTYVRALGEWASSDQRGTLLLDKNPGATPMLPVLRRLIPGAPIIVALRDPRDVVLSCYLRYMRLNPLSVNYHTLESTAARYAFEMGCWTKLRAHIGGWREIRYEELVSAPEKTARHAIETLGLNWDDSVLAYRERGRIVESPSYTAVGEKVHTRAVGRWKRYKERFDQIRSILEPVMDALGYHW